MIAFIISEVLVVYLTLIFNQIKCEVRASMQSYENNVVSVTMTCSKLLIVYR